MSEFATKLKNSHYEIEKFSNWGRRPGRHDQRSEDCGVATPPVLKMPSVLKIPKVTVSDQEALQQRERGH